MWREGEADSDGPALPGAGRRQPAPPRGRRRAHWSRWTSRAATSRLPSVIAARPICSCSGPTTPRWAAWSARDGRDAGTRAAATPARRRPPSPAVTCRRSTACGASPSSGSSPTTSSSAGRRAATSGSTCSSSCRASSSPASCSRSGSGTGRISLAAFWGRRARRLLPALFLVVAALALYLVLNGLLGGPGANGLLDLLGPAGRRHLDPALRQQLALHLRAPVVLRAVLHALATSSTPGRWRSRSSSTWCGRSCSSLLLHVARRSWRRAGVAGHRRPRGRRPRS